VLNTALGAAFENNSTAGPVAIRAVAGVEANVNYGLTSTYAMKTMCELGNGNIAQVYSGDGTTNTNGLRCRIRTPLGADVLARVDAGTGTIYSYRAAKLNSTQFVVAWGDNAGPYLKFVVLNNDGTVAVAATTVATLSNQYAQGWNMAVTASGEVVFAYDKVTSRNICFSRYNAAGALQGSETTVEASANPHFISVLGCAGGHFIIAYQRSAATAAYKFARYNASGVIQGALTTLVTGGSTLSAGELSGIAVELSNGNVVFTVPGSGDAYPDILVYNSSNTLVKSINPGTTRFTTAEIPSVIPLATGGFAAIGRNRSTQTVLNTYDGSGNGIYASPAFGAAGVGGDTAIYGSGVYAAAIGNIGFAILRVGYDGTNFDVRLMVIDPFGTVKGSEIVARASAAGSIVGTAAILTSSNVFAFCYDDTASPYHVDGYYNVVRKSILGAALNSGAADAQVQIGTKGNYTINQSVGAGCAFDNRTATIPGTRGVVAGNSAVLFGLV